VQQCHSTLGIGVPHGGCLGQQVPAQGEVRGWAGLLLGLLGRGDLLLPPQQGPQPSVVQAVANLLLQPLLLKASWLSPRGCRLWLGDALLALLQRQV